PMKTAELHSHTFSGLHIIKTSFFPHTSTSNDSNSYSFLIAIWSAFSGHDFWKFCIAIANAYYPRIV
ncbi:hypothetical protein ACQP3J_27135, partial [Escherichia coli]